MTNKKILNQVIQEQERELIKWEKDYNSRIAKDLEGFYRMNFDLRMWVECLEPLLSKRNNKNNNLKEAVRLDVESTRELIKAIN